MRSEVIEVDLRAAWVTTLLGAGIDAGVVSKQAGHSTVTLTYDRYQRSRRADARRAADAIDALLGDVISAPKVDEELTETSAAVLPLHRDHG